MVTTSLPPAELPSMILKEERTARTMRTFLHSIVLRTSGLEVPASAMQIALETNRNVAHDPATHTLPRELQMENHARREGSERPIGLYLQAGYRWAWRPRRSP